LQYFIILSGLLPAKLSAVAKTEVRHGHKDVAETAGTSASGGEGMNKLAFTAWFK
jgi:hypothetical protein